MPNHYFGSLERVLHLKTVRSKEELKNSFLAFVSNFSKNFKAKEEEMMFGSLGIGEKQRERKSLGKKKKKKGPKGWELNWAHCLRPTMTRVRPN